MADPRPLVTEPEARRDALQGASMRGVADEREEGLRVAIEAGARDGEDAGVGRREGEVGVAQEGGVEPLQVGAGRKAVGVTEAAEEVVDEAGREEVLPLLVGRRHEQNKLVARRADQAEEGQPLACVTEGNARLVVLGRSAGHGLAGRERPLGEVRRDDHAGPRAFGLADRGETDGAGPRRGARSVEVAGD